MALSEEQKEIFKDVGIQIAKSMGTMVLMMAAEKAIEVLTTSNWKESDVSGNRQAAPTEDKAALDKKEADGNSNEGALAKNDVHAQDGNVNASTTEANANDNQAIALNTDAKALKTAAGATEIATKALKFN